MTLSYPHAQIAGLKEERRERYGFPMPSRYMTDDATQTSSNLMWYFLENPYRRRRKIDRKFFAKSVLGTRLTHPSLREVDAADRLLIVGTTLATYSAYRRVLAIIRVEHNLNNVTHQQSFPTCTQKP